jgi:integrase
MARQIHRLSAVEVKTLTAKGMHPDGGGLYLRITDNATKSWMFRYTLDKEAHNMGLGSYPALSLADARAEAERWRKVKEQGRDPIATRQAEKAKRKANDKSVKTFRQCAEAYIDAHRDSWKNPKHQTQWPNTLEAYVYPIFGDSPVSEVTIGQVMEVLEPIWKTKTETASRVRGRIEAVMDWAIVREYRHGNNPARWKGRLDKLLPRRSKVATVKHHPALDYGDLAEFMTQLRRHEAIAARGLEFLILTCTRTNETMGARWEEIDLGKAFWTLPPERTKMKKEHRVPLADDALKVLEQMQEIRTSDYVFPGQIESRPLSNMAFLQLLKRMKRADITAHGFRSTFRDWAAERTAYSREVAEMALGHAIGNKVEAAYRRGDLFEKRRRMMNDWADFASATSAARGNVESLRHAQSV